MLEGTLLFAVALGRSQRLGTLQLLGVVLGLLILAPWRSDGAPLPGVLACLAASASYGRSHVCMGRYLTGRNLPPLVFPAGLLMTASGLLALALPLEAPSRAAENLTPSPRFSPSAPSARAWPTC